ncbi:MAG TPA: transglycosylase SLT domain-containing protein [Methylomirabilota bacterium]|nr:transglycosylase SLT domain-containing protein [Methylomirabilota bacterium]
MGRRLFLIALAALVALGAGARPAVAAGASFEVPAGLESAVEFWKQIFSRYGFGEVVLFDPLDMSRIYSVVRAPDNEQGRAVVEKEKARIVADYDLIDDDSRIRSQRGAREHFLEGLKVAGRYLEQMKKIFREEGLPPELAYLPLVESSFNIRARSSAGALGMWQFMPETGKKFMRIDATVDERRDPLASTRAAARLLKENYRLFGNWPLAITAYNHGTEGIFRGIKTVESDSLVDLVRRYQSPTFGFASKNFYAEFLAVIDIASQRDAYFPYLRPHRPLFLREIEVKRQAPLHALLKPAAISQNDFFEWNPALEPKTKFLPAGYRVKLPPDKVDDFLAAQKRALATASVKKTSGPSKARAWQTSARPRPGASTAVNKSLFAGAAKTAGTQKPIAAKRGLAARQPIKLAAR